MRSVLLIGAGRSASSLIKYFLAHSKDQDWRITVGDLSEELALNKIGNHPDGRAIAFDISDSSQAKTEVEKADLVISMLPAHMHLAVAKECVKQKKHLATASYVTKEMQELHVEALRAGITLLNECGLDPGMDHMSAMKIINDIKAAGDEIISFKSFTGGLVAPESNDNPWGYKFSWNPRNVILAGQGTAKFITNGKYRYLPYSRLFTQTEKIEIDGQVYDGYANRDSLAYRTLYHLEKIPTMLRGTLRQQGFCKAWSIFVTLGLTDDSYIVEDSAHLTYAQITEAFLPPGDKSATLSKRLADFMKTDESSAEIQMVKWTGILEDVPVRLDQASPARILQNLLEQKWKLKESDKDMIVMQHLFEVRENKSGRIRPLKSSLTVTGDNSTDTAMSKTVGLPLAIASKLILNGEIKSKGVLIPVTKEIYGPVLEELSGYGITFSES